MGFECNWQGSHGTYGLSASSAFQYLTCLFILGSSFEVHAQFLLGVYSVNHVMRMLFDTSDASGEVCILRGSCVSGCCGDMLHSPLRIFFSWHSLKRYSF